MTEVEALLRTTLHSHLEDVEAGRGLPAKVRARARRGRIMIVTATAVATAVAVSGAALGTASLLDHRSQEGPSNGIQLGPSPVTRHANGVITYSLAGSSVELHSIEPDGSNDRVIPTPQGQPWHHAWSPDGTQLAVTIFPTGLDEQRSLWVMKADGSDAKQIAQAENVSAPSWSPDGQWVTYSAKIGNQTSIHLVRPDGSEDVTIHAEAAEGTFAIFSAQFSPDGTEILFDRGTDAGYDIFVMATDGSNVRRLTDSGNDYDPYWSPDGSKIVFTREDASHANATTTPTSDIFVMDADGSHVTRLTHAAPQDTFLGAVWSPDGTKIAYNAGRTGSAGTVVVMNADGSDPTELVTKDVLGISWQPVDERTVEAGGTEVWAYQDAALLIGDLNDFLERAGAPRCTMRNADLQTGYAETVPNQGAAVCEFDDGTPLYVLIVRNGESTYKRHFGRQFGPNIYLRGPTWILITSITAPSDALRVIREELGATG